MPLPDKILTTGNQSLNLLQQGGIPLNKISVGGAWRYQYFWKNIDNLKANDSLTSIDEKLILVIFTIDPFISTSFYNFLNKLFFDYEDGKIKFLLKFHPHTPAEKLNINIKNEKIFKISDLSFNELLNKVDTVICSCTTGGLEALILGKKVIYYVPENLISVEPLEGIEHKCLFIINEGDSKDKLLKIINDKIELSDNYSFLQNYFDKINEQVWLDEINK